MIENVRSDLFFPTLVNMCLDGGMISEFALFVLVLPNQHAKTRDGSTVKMTTPENGFCFFSSFSYFDESSVIRW